MIRQLGGRAGVRGEEATLDTAHAGFSKTPKKFSLHVGNMKKLGMNELKGGFEAVVKTAGHVLGVQLNSLCSVLT